MPSARQKHLNFLRELIKDAQKIKDLDYFHQLKLKRDLGEPLNPAQKRRFLEIAQNLKSYIP